MEAFSFSFFFSFFLFFFAYFMVHPAYIQHIFHTKWYTIQMSTNKAAFSSIICISHHLMFFFDVDWPISRYVAGKWAAKCRITSFNPWFSYHKFPSSLHNFMAIHRHHHSFRLYSSMLYAMNSLFMFGYDISHRALDYSHLNYGNCIVRIVLHPVSYQID